MPAFVNWLLRLLPTNPICMRLVCGGSRRVRHLYIRVGYLGLMMVVLLFVLVGEVSAGNISMRALAASGASVFQLVSYLQVGLICLLTPVFMAGAIAQEANPRTWDILLTTPLNNLQIVLGNLFGRLFFIIALLFSSLPLFAVTQYFGGVPGESIFASYAIATSIALIVAATAVTLSVTRTAGRRAVFIFYIAVISYLFVTAGIDYFLRGKQVVAPGAPLSTTVMTPLNPFLALEVLLRSNSYAPCDPIDLQDAPWLVKMWLGRPIGSFCWLCVGTSLILVAFSALRVRIIGAKTGIQPWYRRLLGRAAAARRPTGSRHVGANPIAWRERATRGATPIAVISRWSFVGAGAVLALIGIGLFHTGLWTAGDLQFAIATVVTGEIVVITLVALNMSATAVSREREDGTLDIILTTPIQPGPYLAGKLRGLVQYLLPMILVPTMTLAIVAAYYGLAKVGQWKIPVDITETLPNGQSLLVPLLLPESALALPAMLAPFIAFCVMIGLHWSIKSKGTIGSVIAAVAVVTVLVGVISLCGAAAGKTIPFIGPVFTSLSPVNFVLAVVFPARIIPESFDADPISGRVSLVIGAVIAGAIYCALVYGIHSNMKRTFMFTVRKLAGTN